MKRILSFGFLVILSILMITGCGNKKNTIKKDTKSNVEIGEKTYINQLERISINNTNDYFIITEKRKMQVPEHKKGEMIDFSIAIPYILHVDGVDYNGTYLLGTTSSVGQKDNNQKYNLKISNLTDNYEAEILITNKL